ncbi:hypothetical protein ILYODFUR_018289 [Ilyodon furcidens]|uniref:Uncharacterized protein n=1 Tax=Ilyodon furcidens TaxID=33524 RepID=A0ABV0U6F8_9TELE
MFSELRQTEIIYLASDSTNIHFKLFYGYNLKFVKMSERNSNPCTAPRLVGWNEYTEIKHSITVLNIITRVPINGALYVFSVFQLSRCSKMFYEDNGRFPTTLHKY